ncbi:hypothetical protein B0H17DRAFT_1209126 [Mycena rosella]|uniref:Uncharacterized protein n=1 Tax=Mycena rosella TaxID=1033263 RepID=A0AAD7G619_MYCRO|nr:hypothetical protein B0H17DRAFT_1209126 [Mycena rosella]
MGIKSLGICDQLPSSLTLSMQVTLPPRRLSQYTDPINPDVPYGSVNSAGRYTDCPTFPQPLPPPHYERKDWSSTSLHSGKAMHVTNLLASLEPPRHAPVNFASTAAMLGALQSAHSTHSMQSVNGGYGHLPPEVSGPFTLSPSRVRGGSDSNGSTMGFTGWNERGKSAARTVAGNGKPKTMTMKDGNQVIVEVLQVVTQVIGRVGAQGCCTAHERYHQPHEQLEPEPRAITPALVRMFLHERSGAHGDAQLRVPAPRAPPAVHVPALAAPIADGDGGRRGLQRAPLHLARGTGVVLVQLPQDVGYSTLELPAYIAGTGLELEEIRAQFAALSHRYNRLSFSHDLLVEDYLEATRDLSVVMQQLFVLRNGANDPRNYSAGAHPAPSEIQPEQRLNIPSLANLSLANPIPQQRRFISPSQVPFEIRHMFPIFLPIPSDIPEIRVVAPAPQNTSLRSAKVLPMDSDSDSESELRN